MRNLSIFLGLAIAVFISAHMAQATQVIDDTLQVNSLKVGKQGVGGVTYFNGTIINETTTDGADNPVVFGDGVRIDGEIYRGATPGTSDYYTPLKINDNVEITGTLKVGGQQITSQADFTSQINSLSGDISGLLSIDEVQTDLLSVLVDSVSDLTGAVTDLQDAVIVNRNRVRSNSNFFVCLKDFAEITTYLETSHFAICWNIWMAGTPIPPALTLTTTGIDLQVLESPGVLSEFEPQPQE